MSDSITGWDNMFRQKKDEMRYGDPTTNTLLASGIYSVHKSNLEEDKKIFRFRDHNILKGMWYVFILSCLLWWLPLFGQMIAGYIGGRKAGSPSKGVFVAMVPVLVIFLLIIGIDMGYLPFHGTLTGIPNMIRSSIRSFSPSAAAYLTGIYNSLLPLVGLNGSGFFIIVVFALIGGMMAEMNKREILQATGNAPFYDAFLGKFSGAGLSKFADMVAERVIWTLSTIDHGSRNLLGRTYREPYAIGFEDLRRLPAPSTAYMSETNAAKPITIQHMEPESYVYGEQITHQPPESRSYRGSAFDYSPSSNEGEFAQLKKITHKGRPVRARPKRETQIPSEEDLGRRHIDLSEKSMIKNWKEHNRNIENRKNEQRYRREPNVDQERYRFENTSSKPRGQGKRDAIIYDNEGKLLNKKENQKKTANRLLKKEMPSLIKRALANDKKINVKPSKEEPPVAFPDEKKEDSKPTRRQNSSQSIDRL